MYLSELINTFDTKPGQVSVSVPDDWMQGRSVFGGLQAGVALAAMRTLVPDMPLRTLQATFMAPPSTAVLTARATVLRAGKNTMHVEARLLDGEITLGVVIGVFGASRSSAVHRTLVQPVVETATPVVFPYLPGVVPAMTQHFAATWLRGGLPYSGNPLPEIVANVDLRDVGVSTEIHVLALADFIPPVGLSALTKPTTGSTLTWMLELLTTELSGLPLSGWRIDAEMVAASEGYTSQTVTLWGPEGQPVALSRQSMVVFG